MNAVAETHADQTKSKPVVIECPSIWRKYFSVVSARNFSTLTYVGHKYGAVLRHIEDIARRARRVFFRAAHSDNLSADKAHAAAERMCSPG